VIADASRNLKRVVDRYRFEKTAKGVFPDELKGYERFYAMVTFMSELRCPGRCREVEDTDTSCEVRKCCRKREFHGCYECDDFEVCEKLRSLMGGVHTEACIRNLKAIREMGLEAWLAKGESIMYWDMV